MSFAEYVSASLALIRDPRAYKAGDREGIIAHIRDVAQVTIDRPWEGVRRWSQLVWDGIEKGNLTWQDEQKIQNFRFSLSLAGSGRQDRRPEQGGPRSTDHLRESLCRAFNSRGGGAVGIGVTTKKGRSGLCICVLSATQWATSARVTMWLRKNKLRGTQPRPFHMQYAPQQNFQPRPPSDFQWQAPPPYVNNQHNTHFQQQPKNA